VIVWHMTGRCNLSCRHCYACAEHDATSSGCFDASESRAFLRLLAELRPPALLFSGGEPLCHPDFDHLLPEAHDLGLKVTVSTNGTLVTEREISLLARYASYVGISVDGPRDVHDGFRGSRGAFGAAVRALESLSSAGCRTGLRVTLVRPVIERLGEILELAGRMPLSRVCFYHFIPSGRGKLAKTLLPNGREENMAVRMIIEWTDGLSEARIKRRTPEVLTVGDASDGVALYRYMQSHCPERAKGALELLRRSSRKPVGVGILSIKWDGTVFHDQFSWAVPLGNWRDLENIIACCRSEPELARECKSCGEVGIICGGRRRGFGRECRAGAGNHLP
jgi:MoaA/NifB/PqqE/SkfB family radical SAM enzyme